MSHFAKIAALSGEELRIMIAATALLPVAELALRIFGYRKTQQTLARATSGRSQLPLSPAERLERARRIARCVRIAARKGPYRATCLRESLVTWGLLRRTGIAAILAIGVGKKNDDFAAHAWVEVDGTSLIDAAETRQAYASIHRSGDGEAEWPGNGASP